MSDYNTKPEIMSMADFQRDAKCSFLKIPRWVSETHFKLKGKDYRLSLHEVCVLSTIMDYMQLSIQNKRYQDEFGPFCTISYNTLQEKLNISEYHVKTSLRNLKEIGLIATKKRDAGSSNRTYLTKMCVVLETVANTDSGDSHQNIRAIGLNSIRHSSPTSNTEINNTDSSNTKKTKDIKACIDETPSTSLSVDDQNAPNHPHTGPTRPSDLKVTKTGSCNTQGGDVDTGKDRKYDITTLPGEGSRNSLGLAATRYIRDPLHSLYVQINSRFDFGEFKVMVEELTVEADVDCSDAFCARVLETITEMSRSNGYGKPSSSYIMNPDVIAKALVKCGVAHNDVYKGLFDYKRDYELELVGA